MSFFKKLKETFTKTTDTITKSFTEGLSKTRSAMVGRIEQLVRRTRKIDEEFYEELEEILIAADVGVKTVMELTNRLRQEVKARKIEDGGDLRPLLAELLVGLLRMEEGEEELKVNPDGLTVYLFVGVNGVGKTTTIGKMAHRFRSEGKRVMLAAGDTFRAGAIEQLEAWSVRAGVPVVKKEAGSDPAAVIFDAIERAKQEGFDILLCDTAGRLQNKTNLMNELNKIYRVIQREIPEGPHEVLLVLDATTGQNALSQARTFEEVAKVTGIVLTKLDGTAKGGIVIAIRNELGIPVKLVGLGEKMEDLRPFDAEQFVAALFADLLREDGDE
ncbi:signal recognition particle-docking protein FtsY [Thermicanus aegyptius]|uniref:signal recognition particle-docking protein FtsY n=1 Tax=Thermicanus aegyptius TaxID=94009 RepID=UPI00040A50A5|nr:signal recognition particle-docking protein FtsY [Thermicanus aegyptius]